MADIKFDDELMQHIKTIYGDAELDGRTLKLIHNTWKANPDWIRNTALLKARLNAPLSQARVTVKQSTAPTPSLQTLEIALNDLSGVSNFNTAFREAGKRRLRLFRWKSTRANPSGLFEYKLATSNSNTVNSNTSSNTNSSTRTQNNKTSNSSTLRRKAIVEVDTPVMNNPYMIKTDKGVTVYQNQIDESGNYVGFNATDWVPAQYKDMYGDPLTQSLINELNARYNGWMPTTSTVVKHLQGGTMNNQEELQKAFMAYLIQDAAAQGVQIQSEQDLQAYAQLLGDEGIQAKYQEFMQRMQGGIKARLGAKLEYYRKLKGVCPDGQAPSYYKEGGMLKTKCTACLKAKEGKKMNEVEEFRNKRKQVNLNDTIHHNNKVYDLTGKHKQYKLLTNKDYRNLPKNKQTDVDLKDQARKNACGAKMKKTK